MTAIQKFLENKKTVIWDWNGTLLNDAKKPEEQEIIALDPQPVSEELKKRRSYFR
jgi:hypothetical protein